jgi:hypothetical protein
MIALELALDDQLLELGVLVATSPSQYGIDGMHRIGLAFDFDSPCLDRESHAG